MNKERLAAAMPFLMVMSAFANALYKQCELKKVQLGIRNLRFIVVCMLSLSILLSVAPVEVQAAGGAYTLKWYAADPAVNRAPYLPTYMKYTPAFLACPGADGRYADPLANAVAYGPTFKSSDLDAVTSLMPKNLALGQVVPFEMEIAVSGSTAPENGVLNFTVVLTLIQLLVLTSVSIQHTWYTALSLILQIPVL
ncbi:hypothetical protein [uncultured Methanomethylovorans sp.]|uniref:hypothetical protein n=1 Tax=uncultured Methanomethylovorans sp. TaxID=183759 RepID=UPI002AA77412|nr:hypothetical protein [uncultured Methanomethylovorans sp.]